MKSLSKRLHAIIWPLIVSSLLCIGLFICRFISGGTVRYWFLLWNLFLAWLPLIFAYLLIEWLKSNKWLSCKGLVLTALWLGFLPNSFYLISDFVHLKPTGEVSLLFDVALLMSFAWSGLLLGFTSLIMVHYELNKRLSKNITAQIVSLVLVLSGFAIYLGRYLAWNTWDILVNPAGILFDLSERIVKPGSYLNTFTITTLFTVVLLSMYYTVYKLVEALRGGRS